MGHMEQFMTRFLPVIVTNWSGLTEFATSETAYLLRVQVWMRGLFGGNSYFLKEFVEIKDGTDQLWALPSVSDLRVSLSLSSFE